MEPPEIPLVPWSHRPSFLLDMDADTDPRFLHPPLGVTVRAAREGQGPGVGASCDDHPVEPPESPDADPAPLWAVVALAALLAVLAGVLAASVAGCGVPQFGTGRVP